jgi:hypothetical protein
LRSRAILLVLPKRLHFIRTNWGSPGKVKDVAGVHKTLWPEETAREQILQVDFLVNYSPPPGVEGHDPLKWERWRQVLDAPPPDPAEEKS